MNIKTKYYCIRCNEITYDRNEFEKHLRTNKHYEKIYCNNNIIKKNKNFSINGKLYHNNSKLYKNK